jgi:LAS superfamily LD-carboxypeptidase LdcB
MPPLASRRRMLAMMAALPFVAGFAAPTQPDVDSLRKTLLDGIQRDADGASMTIFGLDIGLATDVLLPATRADALPDGFTPADLLSVAAQGIASAGRQTLRAPIVDDTRALIAAAADEGYDLYVGSGFRSQAYQAAVFVAQVARWGDPETANRYSAQAGHSQHQLGTTIDFTTNFGAFRRSPAADWLRDNAHQFGFVLPYTTAAVPMTGYVDEPWHARWVGEDLATRLQTLGYQTWPTLTADDVVAMLRTEAGLDFPTT